MNESDKQGWWIPVVVLISCLVVLFVYGRGYEHGAKQAYQELQKRGYRLMDSAGNVLVWKNEFPDK